MLTADGQPGTPPTITALLSSPDLQHKSLSNSDYHGITVYHIFSIDWIVVCYNV